MRAEIPQQRKTEELFTFTELDDSRLIADLKDLERYAHDPQFNIDLRAEARRACAHILFELECRGVETELSDAIVA